MLRPNEPKLVTVKPSIERPPRFRPRPIPPSCQLRGIGRGLKFHFNRTEPEHRPL